MKLASYLTKFHVSSSNTITDIAIFDFSFATAPFYIAIFFLERILCKHLHHKSCSKNSISNLEHFSSAFRSFHHFIFQFLNTVLSQNLHFNNTYHANIQVFTPNRNSNFRRFLLLHLLKADGADIKYILY